MLLTNTLIYAFANIFVSGTFYTGFLTQNGIDIVNVGIIAFIPYIAWIFSLFSPVLLRRFKKRRGVLLFNHIFYYGCIVLATTVMPLFVRDPGRRTVWFGVLLLLGNLSNALVGGGSTAWHMHFIPEDDNERNAYFSLDNLVSNVMSTAAIIIASVLADALAGSPHQQTVLVVLRYISFVLFMVEGYFIIMVPKEYPYKLSEKVRLADVFVKPVKCRKFLLTALIAVIWNGVGNVNASTWNYYILNTVGIRYILTYTCSFATMICSLLMLNWWRGLIRRIGWFKVLVLTVFVTGILEFCIGFTTPKTIWLYVLVTIAQGVNMVGAQLVFANMFYLNLPDTDTDHFTTFWNLIVNVSILLGQMGGTAFLALIERKGTVPVFGMQMYGSQLLVWIKCIGYLCLCVYIVKVTPHIRPDARPKSTE